LATVRHWAADNGCYAAGAGFDLGRYVRWLTAITPARCLFAVAPDVVGDSVATLARSLPVLPVIRALGFPVAYVAQDGIVAEDVPWDLFDALFLGGTTAFKLGSTARQLGAAAKARGKWLHMGRVNSRRRLLIAQSFGCDSADGTGLAFRPAETVPQMLRWLDELRLVAAAD
jgi:hypothetical protein